MISSTVVQATKATTLAELHAQLAAARTITGSGALLVYNATVPFYTIDELAALGVTLKRTALGLVAEHAGNMIVGSQHAVAIGRTARGIATLGYNAATERLWYMVEESRMPTQYYQEVRA